MNISDPSTWDCLSDHPSFSEFNFVNNWKDWYEGEDSSSDLATLRHCAILMKEALPQLTLNLIVLDDLTVFVAFTLSVVVGQFGMGCQQGTLYVHVDANPDDVHAAEMECDNLTKLEVVRIVERFVIES